jgi:hypothetical protein
MFTSNDANMLTANDRQHIARSQAGQGDRGAAGDTLLEAEQLAPLEVRYNGIARTLLTGLLSRSRVSAELREMAIRVGVAA